MATGLMTPELLLVIILTQVPYTIAFTGVLLPDKISSSMCSGAGARAYCAGNVGIVHQQCKRGCWGLLQKTLAVSHTDSLQSSKSEVPRTTQVSSKYRLSIFDLLGWAFVLIRETLFRIAYWLWEAYYRVASAAAGSSPTAASATSGEISFPRGST